MKEKYKAIIIDNEISGIANLSQSLHTVDRIHLIGTATRGNIGRDLVIHSRPDLIFLDVDTPGLSGFDFVRDAKETFDWPVKVVFYTACDKHLMESLQCSTFDYLLKPYTNPEFQDVINRFFHFIEGNKETPKSSWAVQQLISDYQTYFLVSTFNGFRSIKLHDIGYFDYENKSKNWFAVLANQKIPLKRNTRADYILKLSNHFKQINQHQIINLRFLTAIEGKKWKCILSSPFDKAENLYITRNYFKSIQDSFCLL
ncbi:MAG: response regulator [Dysgonamonadaceae bacterium]